MPTCWALIPSSSATAWTSRWALSCASSETDPITYESDWFVLRDAVVRATPAAAFSRGRSGGQSPVGMQLAGKYGAGVLSVSVIRDRGTAPDLHKFWQIAEETAAEHGHTVHREDWRMAVAVFLADSRKEAMAQARVGAGRYQREYFEETMGLPAVIDGPPDKIIDEMVARGAWCVGTPDDLIAHIKRLDEQSGGFGGLLIQATVGYTGTSVTQL